MPFPPPKYAFSKHRDLRRFASYKEGELQNLTFELAENAHSNNDIQIKKTKGYSRYSTNASLPGAKNGLGLFGFQPSVGNYSFLYGAWDDATPDTQIYTVKAGVDPITCGATAKFLTNGNTVEFEQANDTLYATNGVDAVVKMSSAGAWSALSSGEPLSGSGTVAKYLSWHNFMMFAARTVNAPNKINVSGAGTPETFTTYTKTFKYAIIGLKPMGDYQVVYTDKSIHLILGYEPSLLSFREVENSHPCVSHRSIVQYKGDSGIPAHIYLGADYVWVFNGSSFVKLGPDGWDKIRTGLNTSRLSQACAWYDTENSQYRISVCTGANTVNDTTYGFDFTSGRWIKFPFRSVAAVAKLGTPIPVTYWQDSGISGIVVKENDGNNLTIPKTLINDASDISASDTTITVDSTTGYLSSGKIVIDSETIQYASLTATEFVGCIRGSDGTTAAIHLDNAPVYPAPKFKYTTISMDDGESNLFKKYKTGWCDLNAATSDYSLMVSYDVDKSGSMLAKSIPLKTSGGTWGTSIWGSFNWGAPDEVVYPDQRFTLSGNGREIKLCFEENSNIGQTELYSFEYKFRVLRKK